MFDRDQILRRMNSLIFIGKTFNGQTNDKELLMPEVQTPNFQPVHTLRVHEEICKQIRHQLAMGSLKSGDKLPAERKLALEFGVCRAAVREALRSLENAGVVTMRKGAYGGAFIRAANATTLTQPLMDLLILSQVSGENIAQVRLIVNDIAVKLACEHRTASDLAALQNSLDNIENETADSERAKATTQFFDCVVSAGHNSVWAALVESFNQVARHSPARELRLPESTNIWLRRMTKSIRTRSTKSASRAMRDYLGNSRSIPNPVRAAPGK